MHNQNRQMAMCNNFLSHLDDDDGKAVEVVVVVDVVVDGIPAPLHAASWALSRCCR